MTVRQFGDGWQVDFYAYGERIRKVFPTKRDGTAYEGKVKAQLERTDISILSRRPSTFSGNYRVGIFLLKM